MNGKIYGPLVQFSCYQHKHKWMSRAPSIFRLSLEVNMSFIWNRTLIELFSTKHFRNGGNYNWNQHLKYHKTPRSCGHHGANWSNLLAYFVCHPCQLCGIFLKPCNTGSGYNPTLWPQLSSAEVFGAGLVFVAHCSEQLWPLKQIVIFSCMQVWKSWTWFWHA